MGKTSPSAADARRPTVGRAMLAEVVAEIGAAAVAERIGVRQSYVYMLLADRFPSRKLARVIEERLRVPMRTWDETAAGAA